MTKQEMCNEYSRCYDNILSHWAEEKIDELDRLAEKQGLKFRMVNEQAWLLPGFMGSPKFELVER